MNLRRNVLETVSRSVLLVFFFSSRRRHTRLQGDWSSDVCSSDLQPPEEPVTMPSGSLSPAETTAAKIKADEAGANARRAAVRYLGTVDCHYYPEIGRASCRERV